MVALFFFSCESTQKKESDQKEEVIEIIDEAQVDQIEKEADKVKKKTEELNKEIDELTKDL